MDALREICIGLKEQGYTSRLIELAATTDFPGVLRDAMNKAVLTGYRSVPKQWEPFTRKRNAPDFKTLYATRVSDNQNLLLVNEGEDYQDSTKSEQEESYHVHKFGRIFGITFEALVNDDTGQLLRSIETWGKATTNTQNALFATRLINADSLELLSDGCAVITSACSIVNVATNTLASCIGTAVTQMALQTDLNGNPIIVTAVKMAVGPVKWSEAQEVTKSAYKIGGTNLEARDKRFTQIEPYMVNGLGTSTKTFLFDAEPCIEIAYLQGKEEPDIMEAVPNSGAGFSKDILQYRDRLVYEIHWIDRKLVFQINT